MKTRLALVSAALLSLTVTGTASANMTSWMEQSLVSVCKSTLTNRPLSFNKTLKTYRINGHRVLPKLMCNGEDIQSFAITHGADRTANYIGERYMTGSVEIQDLAMNDKVSVWFDH